MKTIIIIGVGMSILVFAASRHIGPGRYSAIEGKPASAESPQVSNEARGHRVSLRALRSTEPAQPVYVNLLTAIQSETEPDRKSEALERVVESIFDNELPSVLDSLAEDLSAAAGEFRRMLVRRWAESDTLGAAAWALQLPDGPA